MNDISIAGLDKAAVLAALFNASQPLGMGWLNPDAMNPMTVEQAAAVLAGQGEHLYFDYLNGRVMKIDLTGDVLDPWLYDRDNGQGACAAAIDNVRAVAMDGAA